MPLIYYLCECKESTTKLYRKAKDILSSVKCVKCGKDAKRQLSKSSSSSKVIIDNGFQARAVEVNPDIVEINRERSQKDYRED